MYPAELVIPMKQELLTAGFSELTAATVEPTLADTTEATTLVVINSICGCAARTARPGVLQALAQSTYKPDNLYTVFAGFDTEAVAAVREHTAPYPPSSPSIALYKNGELVHFVERHMIEGRSADVIATHLEGVFEEFCKAPASAN
jgi:putative YphP/YqiW family bacilliredoxin